MATHITSWIARSATTRAVPIPHLPAGREDVLAAILDPSRLPTIPAVAVRVADAAGRPDCLPGDLGPLIAGDPDFSAALLQAVNSAREGPSRAIGSVDRAVLMVGLNRVRALALALSLPPMRPQSKFDPAATAHSLSSIGGAIFARELALRLGRPNPDEDLNAALLRDIGILFLQQMFPAAWATLSARPADPLGEQTCPREREVFGTDHADVGAEVLRTWGLSEEVFEPVRHHHHPDQLAGSPHAERAELLWFAGLLVRLDTLVEHPVALDRLLAVASDRFSLPRPQLADFLDEVRPKIDQFADMMNREIGRCPDYASLLPITISELDRVAPARS
jgi:HD-like signal output (HDOD) protein